MATRTRCQAEPHEWISRNGARRRGQAVIPAWVFAETKEPDRVGGEARRIFAKKAAAAPRGQSSTIAALRRSRLARSEPPLGGSRPNRQRTTRRAGATEPDDSQAWKVSATRSRGPLNGGDRDTFRTAHARPLRAGFDYAASPKRRAVSSLSPAVLGPPLSGPNRSSAQQVSAARLIYHFRTGRNGPAAIVKFWDLFGQPAGGVAVSSPAVLCM
jgi:hypothetical protein